MDKGLVKPFTCNGTFKVGFHSNLYAWCQLVLHVDQNKDIHLTSI